MSMKSFKVQYTREWGQGGTRTLTKIIKAYNEADALNHFRMYMEQLNKAQNRRYHWQQIQYWDVLIAPCI